MHTILTIVRPVEGQSIEPPEIMTDIYNRSG
jgi:hypothetical protein